MRTISTFTLALASLACFALAAVAQPSLGTTALLEGPGAGVDSVVLAAAAPADTWTATANDEWLHLSVANQSGTGSTNVVFGYDANPGATRTGTLTIAGQTLIVTQAGSTYIAAPGPVTTLVASGLSSPGSVALDGAGNVCIADNGNYAVKKWTAANNTVSTLVTPSLATSLAGVSVDGAGNVYYTVGYGGGLFGDAYHQHIEKWTAANNTVSTLLETRPNSLQTLAGGVAVDGVGNVYFTYDVGTFLPPYEYFYLNRWTAANRTVTTLIGSGLSNPTGVAMDVAGNVYVADRGNAAIKEWTTANNTVTTLAASGLIQPWGVAVDGAGNVYIADIGPSAIKKWTAASNQVTTLVASGLNNPNGVAVDGAGNVYIADSVNNAIKELPRAFVDPTPRWESAAAGSDVLPVVLPAAANLLAPFVPISDQPWLTITGITNGVVSFAFSATTSITNRTANITLLGQPISITQAGLGPTLIDPTLLSNGLFQFAFSNNDLGASFTVLTATNLWLPLSNWTVAGPATNTAPGLFQFSTGATNNPQGYYRVRSP